MKAPVSRLLFCLTTGALSLAIAASLVIMFAMNAASEARDRAMLSRLDAQGEVNKAQSDMLHALSAESLAQGNVNRAALDAIEQLARRSPGGAQ